MYMCCKSVLSELLIFMFIIEFNFFVYFVLNYIFLVNIKFIDVGVFKCFGWCLFKWLWLVGEFEVIVVFVIYVV